MSNETALAMADYYVLIGEPDENTYQGQVAACDAGLMRIEIFSWLDARHIEDALVQIKDISYPKYRFFKHKDDFESAAQAVNKRLMQRLEREANVKS